LLEADFAKESIGTGIKKGVPTNSSAHLFNSV